MVTKADVNEFRRLFTARFGVEIDYQTAYRKLTMLVRQVEITYQPIRAAKNDNEKRMKNGSEDLQ